MVMRPRYILAAAGILTAVTLGSWAALVTDDHEPAAQAAPITSAPAPEATINPPRPQPQPRPCPDSPAGLPSGAGRISRITGDFDGDGVRDQLLGYAELNPAGQPGQWHVRVMLATGRIADLALDDTSGWIGPNGLVARRAVDANGDGRDEGLVASTGGASNDTYNVVGLAGCQLRQVRVAGSGPLRFAVGASLGHAGTADACLRSGASSARSTTPTAAPPTPGPRPATAGSPACWFARWTLPAAHLWPPRMTRCLPS
jgi:hypothetical protein